MKVNTAFDEDWGDDSLSGMGCISTLTEGQKASPRKKSNPIGFVHFAAGPRKKARLRRPARRTRRTTGILPQ